MIYCSEDICVLQFYSIIKMYWKQVVSSRVVETWIYLVNIVFCIVYTGQLRLRRGENVCPRTVYPKVVVRTDVAAL